MSIKTTCPQCKKVLRVADECASRRVKCPACAALIDVPALAETAKEQPKQPLPTLVESVLPGGMPPMPSSDDEFDFSGEDGLELEAPPPIRRRSVGSPRFFDAPDAAMQDGAAGARPAKHWSATETEAMPLSVTLVAALFGFGALWTVVVASAAGFAFGGTVVQFINQEVPQDLREKGYLTGLRTAAAIAALLGNFLWFAAALQVANCYGLFTLRTWAWWVTEVWCAFGILSMVVVIAILPYSGIRNPSILIVSIATSLPFPIAILAYFAQPKVRQLFRR